MYQSKTKYNKIKIYFKIQAMFNESENLNFE